ncbi:glutathionylspermidine synthase family protein [Clostridium coskatii]|uniref:Glutathionylspermidine synthase n=1 Tax=Clostridium coskatii TaxID=1705578 RepID=A0A166TUW6_9CLOT|nr:glutathionylspermidine synthase family protein [Clostridium coskatii]OAA94127.1 Glutathionylspermidine synthase [Clostridium coskatii]OBR96689.1 glutathionylspermidine synthase [Clostridium coskatii]
MKYNNVVDELLFEYYSIHCRRKGDVYSPYPFYLTEIEYNKIKNYTNVINRLSLDVLNNFKIKYNDYGSMIPDFPLKDEIMHLNREIPDIFWTRYDCFLQYDGKIFFSEGNYDKPCAQRELAVGEYFNCNNNVNRGFSENFREKFNSIIQKYYGSKKINVLVLADPCHYEEVHLSMLYRKWLEDDRINVIFGGSNNIYIKDEEVYCFNRHIDVILRQFPCENLYEVNDIKLLLNLYEKNKVLILNDPRVIILQSKSIFAYFHKLLRENRLDEGTASVVRECIPYTELLSDTNFDKARYNKDKYVIKPILGRYSEDVFIGKLYSKEEWKSILDDIKEYRNYYVIQEFREIRKDNIVELRGGYPHTVDAFCNLGVYLTCNEIRGICSRWNYDYLTNNETTFITPIGIRNPKLNLKYNKNIKDRYSEFKKVNLDLVKLGFNGAYNNAREYISLDEVILSSDKFEELKNASCEVLNIFRKVSEFVYKNKGWFDEILGTSNVSESIYSSKDFKYLSILGRMDWALDTDNNLKLMELNNETPAGLYESTIVNDYLVNRYKRNVQNPNKNFKNILSENIEGYIIKYSPKTIGIFSTCYYEDYYNIDIVYNIIKKISDKYGIRVIRGNVYNLRVENGRLYYFDDKVDMIYRYFPLNWFEKFNMQDVGKWINNENCINQPVTMIGQSKSIFAVVYEMLGTDFFTQREKSVILKYIPCTDFSNKSMKTIDYICKPILEREGEGIYTRGQLSCQDINNLDNYIFQERINIKTLNYICRSTFGEDRKNLFPILGCFYSESEFIGMYCRLGDLITRENCIYMPVYIDRMV